LTGARFVAFLLAGAFFFAAAVIAVADPALFAAHRFFNAATIAALPAAESFLFGFEGAGVADSTSPRDAAHRFLCASAMRARPAALIL
jgi:hypothetical protein